MGHPKFDAKVPNRIRSLIGAFSKNLPLFHASDGSGYAFLADKVIEIQAYNPQIAANLSVAMRPFNRLDSIRQPLMKAELKRILETDSLAPGVFEIVSKTLGQK